MLASFALFFTALLVFSASKPLYAFFLIAVFAYGGFVTYYIVSNEIPVSENLIALWHEMQPADLAQPKLILWVCLLITEAAILVFNYIKIIYANPFYRLRQPFRFKFAGCLIALFAVLYVSLPAKALRSFVMFDMPSSFAVSAYRYGKSSDYIKEHSKLPMLPTENAFAGIPNITVILIIGNSFGAEHFNIYGYKRNTTPILNGINKAVFYNARALSIYSRWTIPAMLTRDTNEGLQQDASEQSMISFLRQVGFFTSWISNQRFMSERHTTPITAIATEADSAYFNKQLTADKKHIERLDEALLDHLDKQLAAEAANKFIVLHTIGSAEPIDSHYLKSFRLFTPTLSDKDLDTPLKEARANSLDNSILYTDYFISEVIFRLKKINALVFYISASADMSSNGDYRVPFIVWASDKYKESNAAAYSKLTVNSKKELTHGNLFHSILDGAGITADFLDLNKSIFR